MTKVGSTADVRSGADIVVIHEPETGAAIRTKGRFYFLCEVTPPSSQGTQVARELADLVRTEYEYDLSAGIEVALRRALRNANRRAAQRLRDQRGRIVLHCAVAVLVNSELYAARVGAAQVFLVRRARLFLPGEEPGELADFVHRTTTRDAPSLGSDTEVLPSIWRQSIEAGDTVILAGSGAVEGLGAEALKEAAVTLHPRAAAEHVHNRFVADGASGSDTVVFIEIAPAPGSAQRVASVAEPLPPSEVLIAESIRSRLDAIRRRIPRLGPVMSAVRAPATSVVTKGVAVGLELLPRRRPPPLRSSETARIRSARQRRLTTLLAIVLLLVTSLIGLVVVRDYQANQVVNDYKLAVLRIEDDLASANRLATQQRPDFERARERLSAASTEIEQASRSPVAEPAALATYRAQIDTLSDRLSNVILDLKRAAGGARPGALAGNPNGIYIADPGAGALWRVFPEPWQARSVLERGKGGVGAPVATATSDTSVYAIDDGGRVWRAEGNTVANATPTDGAGKWRSVSGMMVVFGNLYVLDAQSGQVWKHEEAKAAFSEGIAYLGTALAPNTARSFAVDGDVWIVSSTGDILRYRRSGLSTTAARIDFTPKWNGEPARPVAIQALEAQRNIYLLDAIGKQVLQLTRDGREVARFALPASLPEPTSFYVSEATRQVFTIHGSRIALTDIAR